MEKCILKKLNTEQQKLVEQNHNLIYSFMNKNHLTENAVEDWYGCCAEALCNAALFFKPEKNVAFSTLAYICMSNAVKKQFEKKTYEICCVSLNNQATEDNEYIDIVTSKEDEFKAFEFYEIYNKNYNKLKSNHKKIIEEYINSNKTFEEIGKEFSITRQRASCIYRKFLNNIYSDLYESEGR